MKTAAPGAPESAYAWARLFVALVPGPNILAYYFGFRLVGHYLSRRGAKHALTEIIWQARPCAELSRLRPWSVPRGPRELTSNQPIRHPDDLGGIRLRVPEGWQLIDLRVLTPFPTGEAGEAVA